VERSKKFSKNLFFAPTPLRFLAVISIEILKNGEKRSHESTRIYTD